MTPDPTFSHPIFPLQEHRRNFALRKRIAERLCLTAAFNMLDADNSGELQV